MLAYTCNILSSRTKTNKQQNTSVRILHRNISCLIFVDLNEAVSWLERKWQSLEDKSQMESGAEGISLEWVQLLSYINTSSTKFCGIHETVLKDLKPWVQCRAKAMFGWVARLLSETGCSYMYVCTCPWRPQLDSEYNAINFYLLKKSHIVKQELTDSNTMIEWKVPDSHRSLPPIVGNILISHP